MKNLSRGGLEGDIYVQVPDGTKVHFGSHFGARGGNCQDDKVNAHTTRTCTARDIISVAKLMSLGSQPIIWLVHTGDTAPTDVGGKTTYFIYLASAGYDVKTGKTDVLPTVGLSLGAFLGMYDDVGYIL